MARGPVALLGVLVMAVLTSKSRGNGREFSVLMDMPCRTKGPWILKQAIPSTSGAYQ